MSPTPSVQKPRTIDGIVARTKPATVRPNSRRRRTMLAASALAVLVIIVGVGLLVARHHADGNLDNVNTVMSKVSKLYVLPTNETPALATVTDSAKLQNAFAHKVQDGDKILIYQNNRIAIAWRPSINRIVDVEPVSIDTPPSATKQK